MSDVVAVETAVAAPVEQPAVTVNEPQLNAAERRQGIRERASGRTVAATVNNVSQPRDEVGRFTAASTEPEAVQDTPVADATGEIASTEAVIETPAVKERIEIPAGHPLRDRGKQYLDELTNDELRGTLNSAVRAREVETVNQKLRQESEARLRAEAERDAFKEQMLSFIAQPEVALKYNELKQWDAAEADRWLRGVMGEMQEQVGGKVQQYTEQHQHQATVEAVESFNRDVQEFANTALSAVVVNPKFNSALSNARQRYGIAIELAESRGEPVSLDLQTFLNDYLVPEIERWPEMQQYKAQQSEQERQRLIGQARAEAKAEAEAELRAQAQAVQQTRNRNPLGRIPAQANVAQQINVTPPTSAASIRENLRTRLRGLR